ncbi:MAG: capsular exopolysaccharide synthesis family protein [Planctomycetota bacterium]|jgi:capsular exopolysaccharide synthesis family protein
MSDVERLPGHQDSGGAADSEQAVRVLQLLWRWKLGILGVPLLCAGVTFAYYKDKIPGFHVVSRYRANANVLIEVREKDPVSGGVLISTAPRVTLSRMERLFKSGKILKPLSLLPEIQQLPSMRQRGLSSVREVLSKSVGARVDEAQERLSISCELPRREDAEVVVAAAITIFKEYHEIESVAAIERNMKIFRSVRDEADELLDELEAEIIAKRKELGITVREAINPFGSEVELIQTNLREAHYKLVEAEVRLDEAQANTETGEVAEAFGRRLRIEHPEDTLEQDIQGYLSAKSSKETKLIDLTAQHGEDYQGLQALRDQIHGFEEKLNEVFAKYSATELIGAEGAVRSEGRHVARFREELAKAQEEFFAREVGLGELRRLEERRATAKEERQKFADLIASLDVSQQTSGLSTTIIDPPRAKPKPVYPEPEKMAMIGAGAGLGLMLLFVALRGFTDHRILTPEEVPTLLGASVVGVLPSMKKGKAEIVGRVVLTEPGSLAAEAVRSVRTATAFALGEDGRGIVLITSSISGEGKSISSSNLAIAFAQSGRKTLLVDADLRKPGQNGIFNLIGKRGLGDAIAGSVTWESAVVQGVAGDLDLLPAGGAEMGPAELLESGACRTLFAELREVYDVIIVDSSPVLETAETRMLSNLADVCLFVIRLKKSTGPNARRAVGILQSVDANIIGVFLNGASKRRGAKAYAEGISYGYGYGHGGGYGNVEGTGATPQMQKKRASESAAEAWS